jgi:hypothetical protein
MIFRMRQSPSGMAASAEAGAAPIAALPFARDAR